MLPENQIICGDNIKVMHGWPDNCIPTIICDPPYGLSFMGKKWDYQVPSIEEWQECLRVLKPGGTLLCFAGSRTQHRMACNVEDAGFIIKDCIMWLYGSGFPKATDISKQLDKGHEREVVGDNPNARPNTHLGKESTSGSIGYGVYPYNPITAPATPEAQLWNGWKSHGLKPAYEPILVAMKPNDGTYAENALKWGVSGLWIDGGRIPKSAGDRTEYGVNGIERSKNNNVYGEQSGKIQFDGTQGRFPANIILDEETGAMLDEQSGESKSQQARTASNRYISGNDMSKMAGENKFRISDTNPNNTHDDSGGASRFFYCAKASKKERNAGCEGLEKKQTWASQEIRESNSFDVFESDGRPKTLNRNNHPTVKPLALMEYLCNLTKTPTGGIVLDPYCGSGTTCKAAQNTGRRFIGIDKNPEYCEIARQRLEAVDTGVPVKEQRKGQGALFPKDNQ